MRDAMHLDPEACRNAVRMRFSDRAMVARYLDLYARIALQPVAHDAAD